MKKEPVKYQKIKLPHGKILSEKEFESCVAICRHNGIKPTKDAIVAAYMSFWI